MSFEEECLQKHNELRRKHGCPPLTINKALTAYAKEWANELARKDIVRHRPNPKHGENIYFGQGIQNVNGDLPAQMWYNEIKDYDFAKSEFNPRTGHFTQLVWKETKQMGAAIVRKNNKTWVVANYSPPGNVIGQFKEMVPAPTN